MLAGMTEFLILDGVDDFPLLAIGMAPVVLTAALVLTVPNARLSSIAFQVLVFSPVILSPANPQHYSAEAYLFSSVIVITSGILLFVLLRTLFPTSDALLRHWYLTSARAEMHDLLAGNRFRWHDGEALFRELTASGNWPRCSLLKATTAAKTSARLSTSSLGGRRATGPNGPCRVVRSRGRATGGTCLIGPRRM